MPRDQAVHWFRRTVTGFVRVRPESDGVFRSTVFPGLWLDPKGLFTPTTRPLTSALKKGLASPEHAAFVTELEARKAAHKKPKSAKKSRRKSK